jgi:hypothetical protein
MHPLDALIGFQRAQRLARENRAGGSGNGDG